MYSIDAYNSLIDSNESWNAFRLSQSNLIDLTLVELKNFNLTGRDLSNCNFSGADLENSNLDRCIIRNSFFKDTCLENISLVRAEISSTNFSEAKLKNATIRDVIFTGSTFQWANFEGATFAYISLNNCILDSCIFKSVRFKNATFLKSDILNVATGNLVILDSLFIECNLNNCTLEQVQFKNTEFRLSSLINIDFKVITIEAVNILNSKLRKVNFLKSNISQFDLSNSSIIEADLSNYELTNSILMDVSIVRCIWPTQKGKTTLLGKYLASPTLLGQPVQDVKGISPLLRREIADAQFLREITSKNNYRDNFLLRIWGSTTNYGQSLTRLAIVSLLINLCLSIVFVFTGNSKINFSMLVENYIDISLIIFSSFFSIDSSISSEYTQAQKICLTLSRISGFVILGLWVGLATNKLGKLSSE